MQPSPTVPAAIIVGGAIVAFALYVSMGGSFDFFVRQTGHPERVRLVTAADHIFGNPAARAVIVEYADLGSPYCKGFADTLHQIVATEGADGQVAWVYRAFPLSFEGGEALALARAAECAGIAGGEDAFWRFTDLLYVKQPVALNDLGAIAKEAGVPLGAFASCYADAANRVDARIEADRTNALDVGATGAPYSILLVKGRAPVVLDGAYTYDALREVVDRALVN